MCSGMPTPRPAASAAGVLAGLPGEEPVKTPRAGKVFLNRLQRDVIRQVISNLFEFEKKCWEGKTGLPPYGNTLSIKAVICASKSVYYATYS